MWSSLEKTGLHDGVDIDWCARPLVADGSEFDVVLNGAVVGQVKWAHSGDHNLCNGISAIAAARHVGVTPEIAAEALCQFEGVKRRMELLAQPGGVAVYDDFAHHPTAIETTLAGLRAKVGKGKIIAIIEPRSNTMRMGAHLDKLAAATQLADEVIWYQPEGLDWSLQTVIDASHGKARILRSISSVVNEVAATALSGNHIVIMSNGGFGGIHQLLIDKLESSQ